jgi:hypothetical protein
MDIFEVLEFDGYNLHQEIIALNDACNVSFQSSDEGGKRNEKEGITEPASHMNEEGKGRGLSFESLPKPNLTESTRERCADGKDTTVKAVKLDCPDNAAPLAKMQGNRDDGAKSESSGNDVTLRKSDETKDVKQPEGPGNEGASEKPPSDKDDGSETPDDSSMILFDSDSTLRCLSTLRATASTYTRGQLINAIVAHAVNEGLEKPRHFPTFFCFHWLIMLDNGRVSRDSDICVRLFSDLMKWPAAGDAELEVSPPQQTGERRVVSVAEGRTSDEGDKTSRTSRHPQVKSSIATSKDCLLRCLAVANQGTAAGMIGWLEYGADNSYGRIASSPFSALEELAYAFASVGNWHLAVDVLRAQVSKCDQHLPLYHPCTLAAMIHLSGAERVAGHSVMAMRSLGEAAARLSFYLVEQESQVFLKFRGPSENIVIGSTAEVIQFQPIDLDALSMLQAFVRAFEVQVSGRFLNIVGIDGAGNPNDIFHACQSFRADAFSVLANCLAARETQLGLTIEDKRRTSKMYWRAAYKRYEAAFKGLLLSQRKLTDDSVVSAAHGMARCLRELSQRSKALHILSSIISAFGRTEEGKPEPHGKLGQASMTFLPGQGGAAGRFSLPNPLQPRERNIELMALCLWTMALYSVEENKSERGRMRALSLLHSAAEALRITVYATNCIHSPTTGTPKKPETVPSVPSSNTRVHTLLRCIEQEATKLLRPIAVAVEEAAPQAVSNTLKTGLDNNPGVYV